MSLWPQIRSSRIPSLQPWISDGRREKQMYEKNTDKEKIPQILQKINEAWSKSQPDELTGYFHDDLIILGPDLQSMGEGKGAFE